MLCSKQGYWSLSLSTGIVEGNIYTVSFFMSISLLASVQHIYKSISVTKGLRFNLYLPFNSIVDIMFILFSVFVCV